MIIKRILNFVHEDHSIIKCLCLTLLFNICLGYSQIAFASEDIMYEDYILKYESVSRENEAISVQAVNYEQQKNTSISDGVLQADSNSTITYKFKVEKEGLYNININYKPILGGSEIIRKLYINSEIPFKEAEHITLNRFYEDKDKEYKVQPKNQTFPSQIEVDRWNNQLLTSFDGFVTDPFAFYFKAGENLVTIEAIDSSIMMKEISLIPAKQLQNYKTYIQDIENNGIKKYTGNEIKIQAEDATLKTSPSLYPINNRTSPLTEPYHPYYIVLNTIGGNAWRFQGQSIEWEVEVPSEGLYKLAFKYRQSQKRGMVSTRKLRINGKVPFKEANNLSFNYNTDFSIDYLSDRQTNEEYYFHLKEGKNTISMEVTLGLFGKMISRVQEELENLNGIYQDIIVITSTSPDKYRDYNLEILIPDLHERFIAERNNLQNIVDEINKNTGSFSDSTSIINMLIVNLNKMIEKPKETAKYLVDYKSSMSALGDWIVSVQEQPLEVDYFIVAPEQYELPNAEGNMLQKFVHGIRSFVGSFVNKYDTNEVRGDSEVAKTINVWVSTGRDQYNILQKMVNETFCKENNINVKLKLVGADVIVPATLTGNGPDVNIQVASSTPINFGFRGGAYDLTKFKDFDQVATRFSPAALDTFKYKGACYALPDQMSFNVMFYRTDIFNELGLSVPTTLHDFLGIVPILQKNNMDIYFSTTAQQALGAATGTAGSAKNVNPVYVSLLYQNGGKLYQNEGEFADITSKEGIEAFKYWTELYTKHNFIVQTDFVTRFRMGEIPVGIVDFSEFNRLSVAAPEIKGKWAMAQIPGTIQDNGSVRYDTPVTVSGSLIVKQIAEKNNTIDQSWEFLKWWTSEDTQYKFASEMESVLGLAGRYSVANLGAFKKIAWGRTNLNVLENSLDWLRTVPQVPGSYITGRVIENAFLSVVTETSNVNPTDALYKAVDQLNQELTNKRKEFHIE